MIEDLCLYKADTCVSAASLHEIRVEYADSKCDLTAGTHLSAPHLDT